jgi:hypothetical protein
MIGFSPNATSLPYSDDGEVIGSWILPTRLAHEKMFCLFCFSFAGGGVSSIGSWSHLLPGEIELCALQLPGQESRINEVHTYQKTERLLASLLTRELDGRRETLKTGALHERSAD